jgi:hypothetical protein
MLVSARLGLSQAIWMRATSGRTVAGCSLLRYRRLGALEGYYLPRLRQADGRVRDEGLVSIIVREGLHAAVGTVAEVLYRQNAGGAVVSLTMRDSPEEDMLNDSGAHDVHYGHAQGLRLHCR